MSTMNVAPEVGEFLAAVRVHLADLDADEQREILDGLEADLGELVADRGADALGEPAAYAAELRAAAGLEAVSVGSRKRPIRTSVTAVLDACHARLDLLVAAAPFDLAALLAWARPLWWALRAWTAVQLVDLVFGRNSWSGVGLVPSLHGWGVAVLLAAVIGSVLIGTGRLWPGGDRGLVSRLVLLALNLFAVAMVPVVLAQVNHGSEGAFWRGYQSGYDSATSEVPGPERAGVYVDGRWVSNIYPYDAHGRPLVGVQLYDQVGKPIKVITQPEYAVAELGDDGSVVEGSVPVDPATGRQLPRIFYPWTNGAAQLYNVFPLPSRLQPSEELSPTAFSETDQPAVGPFPLASVPSVSLPGVATGVQKQP